MDRLLEDFAELASDWFWETDQNHVFTYFSDKLTEITGVPKNEYIGRRRDQIALENIHQEKWRNHLEDLKERRPFKNLVYWTKRPTDGSDLCVRISGQPIFSASGAFVGYRGVGTDITKEQQTLEELNASNIKLELQNKELKKAKESATKIAQFDALTDLPNRRYLDKFLKDTQATAQASDSRFIVQIDLDKFKEINDRFGHDTGDALLKYVGENLRNLVADEDFLARLGGDEFVVICGEGTGEAGVDRLANKIVEHFSQPVLLNGNLCRFGASVGFVEHPAHDLMEGLKRADAALYQAKRSGRGVARRLDVEAFNELAIARRIADEIAAGLRAGEFDAYFQPQFCADTFDFVGVEALARWRHSTRGVVSPAAFLTIAEEHGLLSKIDAQVHQRAIAFCRSARLQNTRIPKCAVNVSLDRLKSPDIVQMSDEMKECETRFALELVETISFDIEDAAVSERIDVLREDGCEIEIDDFGSGHASISSLVRIKPHRLKVDKALIRPLATSDAHRSLVEAIVAIGRALSVEVVAEGVETQEQVEILREIGCAVLQGFFFAPPMAGGDLLEFIGAEAWPSANEKQSSAA